MKCVTAVVWGTFSTQRGRQGKNRKLERRVGIDTQSSGCTFFHQVAVVAAGIPQFCVGQHETLDEGRV